LYNDIPTNQFSFPPLNFSQGTVVTATVGQTRTNINAALVPSSGSISGKITAFDGSVISDTFSGPNVTLYQRNPATGQFVNSNFTSASTATGVYSFTGLSNGQYKILVGQSDAKIMPHAAEWYNNANVVTSATTISITNGVAHTGIDVQLVVGGCIYGKIIDVNGVAQNFYPFEVLQGENNNQPIAVINNGNNFFWSSIFTPPQTDGVGQGEFTACGLPTGTYLLNCDQTQGNTNGETITATVTAGQASNVGVCQVGFIETYLPIILKNVPVVTATISTP
jgi:hypothetical protein